MDEPSLVLLAQIGELSNLTGLDLLMPVEVDRLYPLYRMKNLTSLTVFLQTLIDFKSFAHFSSLRRLEIDASNKAILGNIELPNLQFLALTVQRNVTIDSTWSPRPGLKLNLKLEDPDISQLLSIISIPGLNRLELPYIHPKHWAGIKIPKHVTLVQTSYVNVRIPSATRGQESIKIKVDVEALPAFFKDVKNIDQLDRLRHQVGLD
jgi:hypothetical protein